MADAKETPRVEELIRELHLQRHPAGMGYYIESFRSKGNHQLDTDTRNYSAMMYYLQPGTEHNTWHKLKKSDEYFCFYEGSPLHLLTIKPGSKYISAAVLGRDVSKGEAFHSMIPAGTWLTAWTEDAESYSLVGVMTAPGFDYLDAVVAKAEDLEHVQDPRIKQYLAKQ